METKKSHSPQAVQLIWNLNAWEPKAPRSEKNECFTQTERRLWSFL